jgi:hypothetical protein
MVPWAGERFGAARLEGPPSTFRVHCHRHSVAPAVYRNLADDPDGTAELDAAFLRLLDETRSGTAWEAEYLLVTAVRT